MAPDRNQATKSIETKHTRLLLHLQQKYIVQLGVQEAVRIRTSPSYVSIYISCGQYLHSLDLDLPPLGTITRASSLEIQQVVLYVGNVYGGARFEQDDDGDEGGDEDASRSPWSRINTPSGT